MQITVDEQSITLEKNATGIDLAEKLHQNDPHQALALKIDGDLFDLCTPLPDKKSIALVDFSAKEGKEVFWHTSAHVLAQAILRLYPKAIPTIGPPIEQGFYYDFANLEISEKDFKAIEKEIQKILAEKITPEKVLFKDKSEAKKTFSHNHFKCALIDSFEDSSTISAYRQSEFFDLCRGPHLPSLKKIKAFKILKTSSAYWKGDANNESLTRIYAISFPEKSMLKEYLTFLEEAKKRDHKVIGKKLELFSFLETAPGMPLYQPHGMRLFHTLTNFWDALHQELGYQEIKTPIMMDQSLWEQSGHWEHYQENMYTSKVEKHNYAIKPMNCPACMLYYQSKRHSFRDLPLKISEIGLVHRHEMSGSLSGLLRVRSFHQDDAHIFMTKEQITEQILEVLNMADTIYNTFGLKYHLELSTRPIGKSIGTDEDWDVTTNALSLALEKSGKPYRINEGDGAFYGPKIDLHVQDSINRSWQCGTIQLDMSLPERFNLSYTDSDGSDKRPIMIHRALYGSIERFMAILIEHYKGKFPLWLNPRQIRILTVADRHQEYAKSIASQLKDFFVHLDDSQESISKKVRNAQLTQTNYTLIIGDKELASKTITIRKRDNTVLDPIAPSQFIEAITLEKNSKSLSSTLS